LSQGCRVEKEWCGVRPESTEHHGTPADTLTARIAVAAVWAHQGVWAKLLARDPGQRAILATVPGIGPGRARAALVGVGLAETALAAWILTGRAGRATALAQTVAVVAMTATGLHVGGAGVPHPLRLLARNAGILTLAWLAVDDDGR
jgi:hypothetical protein